VRYRKDPETQLVPDPSDCLALDDDFETFYLAEFRAVVGLAYALSGNRLTAEDLAQEAFLAAHRDWDRVSGYDRPALWVRKVVANLSASAFRRRTAEMKALARLGTGHLVIAEPSAEVQEFWAAVRSLPRRQAQVMALHYLEDRPVSEVAAILEMAPGTVKKHLHDGRQRLIRKLSLEEGP